jgi:hypothetical protein
LVLKTKRSHNFCPFQKGPIFLVTKKLESDKYELARFYAQDENPSVHQVALPPFRGQIKGGISVSRKPFLNSELVWTKRKPLSAAQLKEMESVLPPNSFSFLNDPNDMPPREPVDPFRPTYPSKSVLPPNLFHFLNHDGTNPLKEPVDPFSPTYHNRRAWM